MKILRIIKKQAPHKPSNSEISKKINLFLQKPSQTLTLKESRQMKSLLRHLKARLKHSYFKGLCKFKYDQSNLLNIVKTYTSNHRPSVGESICRFLIRYCYDTSTLLSHRYTKEYICYKHLTQHVVDKIVNWALIKGKDNKSGLSENTIHTYISYIKASLRHAFGLALINHPKRIATKNYPSFKNEKYILRTFPSTVQAFANSDLVPYRKSDKSLLNNYTTLGIILIEETVQRGGYIKFIKASLPKGWTKQLDKNRNNFVNLIDAKGRSRASFEYRPSFGANIYIHTRFLISPDYRTIFDHVTNEEISITTLANESDFYKIRHKAEEIATTWLNQNYPNWQSPAAYWD